MEVFNTSYMGAIFKAARKQADMTQEQVAEQVHAPEHLLVVVVGGGGLVVDDAADGRGEAVHDLVAEVCGGGGNRVVVA